MRYLVDESEPDDRRLPSSKLLRRNHALPFTLRPIIPVARANVYTGFVPAFNICPPSSLSSQHPHAKEPTSRLRLPSSLLTPRSISTRSPCPAPNVSPSPPTPTKTNTDHGLSTILTCPPAQFASPPHSHNAQPRSPSYKHQVPQHQINPSVISINIDSQSNPRTKLHPSSSSCLSSCPIRRQGILLVDSATQKDPHTHYRPPHTLSLSLFLSFSPPQHPASPHTPPPLTLKGRQQPETPTHNRAERAAIPDNKQEWKSLPLPEITFI